VISAACAGAPVTSALRELAIAMTMNFDQVFMMIFLRGDRVALARIPD
jgi:hypothetical protein